MNTSVLTEIERKIYQLSPAEQLWLIERLAHRLRESSMPDQRALERELSAMASDPDIQRELRAIEVEFAATESDGLE